MRPSNPPSAAVLALYPALARAAREAPPRRLAGGLINATWQIGGRWVLQRLHPIFGAEVHDDIAALGPPLRAAGVPVPPLVAAGDGARCVVVEGAVWRVLERLPGGTFERVERPGQARAAGAMLARFHGALVGVDHTFAFSRAGVHDTAAHLARLRAALAAHEGHRLRSAVAPVAGEILARFDALGPSPALPRRIGHGDPKIANFLFDAADRVVGVVDLDTMGWTTLDCELGDALRSWCNADSEDAASPSFDRVRFEAGLEGYLAEAGAWLTEAERSCLPTAGARIALELASRFAADALNESYFGWDADRFATAGEHHLARARAQLALAEDALRQRADLRAIVDRLSA